jgi:predicted NBD/HSP70 family sugar kinase
VLPCLPDSQRKRLRIVEQQRGGQTGHGDSALHGGQGTATHVFSGLGGGANQAGGRAYNERLTISLIRLNGPLPKAELARLTGLSAQTLSQIVRRLEADGLLIAQEPLRGRIGQPSVPYALNPMGALSFGVKIGRRSTDVVLCDLNGRILDRDRRTYDYPLPDDVIAFVTKVIARMQRRHPDQRFAGVGIAMPFELWKWANEVDAPQGSLDAWHGMNVTAVLEARSGLPTYIANDASAACGAELHFSYRGSGIDLLYIFIGSFAGGGVVLNGALYQGRSGNAGALGSMPITHKGERSQLIHHASLLMLEKRLVKEKRDPELLQDADADWSVLGRALDDWIDAAAEALASTIVSGACVIEFSEACIDGAMPTPVLARLVDATRSAVGRHDHQGLSPFEIRIGQLGADARALGGAMLPIMENYACGQDVLLKSPLSAA